jgi:hypothetical protein
MKSFLQLWTHSNTGDVTVKVWSIRYRYSPITRCSSTSQQPNYSIAGKRVGRENSPVSISKSSSAPVPKTVSQMLYPGVRSTEKGGSENQPITTILHPTHFSGRISAAGPGTIYIYSGAQLGGIPVRKWNEEFTELVRMAGQEDNKYSKARRELEQEAAPAGSVLNGSNAEESEAVLPRKE